MGPQGALSEALSGDALRGALSRGRLSGALCEGAEWWIYPTLCLQAATFTLFKQLILLGCQYQTQV